MTRDRGQAHTLEAVTAAILLLAGVGFALQMTAVTPLSASTSSQHLENQLQMTGKGVLASNAESGDLKKAVLYWDENESQFYNADNEGYYTTNLGANNFTRALDRTYGPRNVAYNVNVIYHTSNDDTERKQMIRQGEPSDHAIVATRSVTIVDDDQIVDEDWTYNSTTTVSDVNQNPNSTFYMPDAGNATSGNRAIYNNVRVEVVAWRI
ncbi:MAG: hypothetical protein V5A39_05350 [Haloarculaceae archaeon]